MRGALAAVLGVGPLQSMLGPVEVGYRLKVLVDRVVDMPGGGEARLKTRRGKDANRGASNG